MKKIIIYSIEKRKSEGRNPFSVNEPKIFP
jgi:hypothetical protein